MAGFDAMKEEGEGSIMERARQRNRMFAEQQSSQENGEGGGEGSEEEPTFNLIPDT